MSQIFESSIISLVLGSIISGCANIEKMLAGVYFDSKTYKCISKFFEIIKNYFRYSFFGKCTEIIIERDYNVFTQSVVMLRLMKLRKGYKEKFKFYLINSRMLSAITDIKRSLLAFPVKAVSIIIFSAMVINVVLMFFLKKEISLFGWFIRIMFFLISIRGLFCGIDWQKVKNTSIMLRD